MLLLLLLLLLLRGYSLAAAAAAAVPAAGVAASSSYAVEHGDDRRSGGSCPGGKCSDDLTCILSCSCHCCRGGTACPDNDRAFCLGNGGGPYKQQECEPGTFSQDCSLACTKCPAGTFQRSKAQTSCENCTVGRYQPEMGMTGCIPCEAGRYQPGVNATGCNACVAGRYQPNMNASSCTDCPAGQFQPRANATSCIACSAGRYQPASNATLGCIACASGRYGPKRSAAECISCMAGKYQPSKGQGACIACSAGRMQPNRSALACVPAVQCDGPPANHTKSCNGTVDATGKGESGSICQPICESGFTQGKFFGPYRCKARDAGLPGTDSVNGTWSDGLSSCVEECRWFHGSFLLSACLWFQHRRWYTLVVSSGLACSLFVVLFLRCLCAVRKPSPTLTEEAVPNSAETQHSDDAHQVGTVGVAVRMLNGHEELLTMQSTDTVGAVKTMLFSTLNVPVLEQRLLLNHTELEDEDTPLTDCGFTTQLGGGRTDTMTLNLHLVLRLPPTEEELERRHSIRAERALGRTREANGLQDPLLQAEAAQAE